MNGILFIVNVNLTHICILQIIFLKNIALSRCLCDSISVFVWGSRWDIVALEQRDQFRFLRSSSRKFSEVVIAENRPKIFFSNFLIDKSVENSGYQLKWLV